MEYSLNIEERNLQAIEGLLAQSVKGFHHLFDKGEIARILRTPTEECDFFTEATMEAVENLFYDLITHETLEDKRDFLNQLDRKSYELVLRAYFHIVESSVASSTDKH